MQNHFERTMPFFDPITALIAIVLFFLVLKIFYVPKDVLNGFPPGPKGLPIIGNLHMLNLKRPQETFMQVYYFHVETIGKQ